MTVSSSSAAGPELEHPPERQSVRAERLREITRAIARAISAEEVFAALVDRVSESVGASSSGLWLIDDEPSLARLVRSRGYHPVAAKQLETLPFDLSPSIPASDCIRTGEPVWIASQTQLVERYPHLSGVVTPGRSYRVVCLPLRADGRMLGALCFTIEEAGEESEEGREFLLLIAHYASQAIERLRLLRAEQKSRALADAASERLQALTRESQRGQERAEQLYRFAQSVMSAERVESVFDAAIAAVEGSLGTSRSAILVFDERGIMRFRAARHLSDAYRAAVEGHSPWARDAKSPEPVLVTDVTREASLASYANLFRSESIGALAFIPLVTRGRLLGKVVAYYTEPHEFTAADIESARAIANHLASVVARFSAMAELEEIIRSNELFAGVLAHDLRNPLNAMMTATQLLLLRARGDGAAEREERPLQRILSSGRRMSTMIGQLLDFTRARSGGGIPVEPRAANLSDLCAQAAAELELGHPEWRIHRTTSGDPTGTWDPDRMLQIFSNLIANACQHGSPDAPVVVNLDGTAQDTVDVEVHNAGAIPEELVPNLFDPFRSTRFGRDNSRGLGLGLYIVREVVREHRGTVNVTSSAADGTRISIRLPRHAEASAEKEPEMPWRLGRAR
jgi:signal transduction histidine kinase